MLRARAKGIPVLSAGFSQAQVEVHRFRKPMYASREGGEAPEAKSKWLYGVVGMTGDAADVTHQKKLGVVEAVFRWHLGMMATACSSRRWRWMERA